MRRTDRRPGERGTATVEFALLLPVMVVLALIVSEGAAVIRTHQILNNAAREGVRVAIVPENQPYNGVSNSGVIAAVKNAAITYAANNGVTISASNVTVNQLLMVPGAGGVGLKASQVTVTYSYALTYLPNFGSISASIPMSVSAEFKNFY
jgi:Flp pilus assembly protein TadG